MPIEWEEVSVAPVILPDGRTTVPVQTINSMKANKIGLKGGLNSEMLGVHWKGLLQTLSPLCLMGSVLFYPYW